MQPFDEESRKFHEEHYEQKKVEKREAMHADFLMKKETIMENERRAKARDKSRRTPSPLNQSQIIRPQAYAQQRFYYHQYSLNEQNNSNGTQTNTVKQTQNQRKRSKTAETSNIPAEIKQPQPTLAMLQSIQPKTQEVEVQVPNVQAPVEPNVNPLEYVATLEVLTLYRQSIDDFFPFSEPFEFEYATLAWYSLT